MRLVQLIIYLFQLLMGKSPDQPTPTPAPSPNTSATLSALLAEHNLQRSKLGLLPLRLSANLNQAAQDYAELLARQQVLSHTAGGTSLTQRLQEAHYPSFRKAAENIAAGQVDVEEVLDDWMLSPGHRDNILDPQLGEVGFGVARDARGQLYWVADFATPWSARMILKRRVVLSLSTPVDRRRS